MVDRHLSKETRQKLSDINTGRKHTKEARQKMSDAAKYRPAVSDETRQKMSDAARRIRIPPAKTKYEKMSDAQKRNQHPNFGKPLSKKTKRKMSEAQKGKTISEAQKRKISETLKGTTRPEDVRRKVSAAHQGIPYDEWEAFACEKKYCPKFNNACRESNREKYGRRCFICGKTEKANGQKLSVHHIDMDKAQGCESNWKLVPLCRSCHAKTHNDELIARLGYLLKISK